MHVLDLTTLYTEGIESGVNTYLQEKARWFAESAPQIRHTLVLSGSQTHTSKLYESTVHTIAGRALPWNREHHVLFDHAAVRRILGEAQPSIVEVDCAYVLGRVAARALDPAVPVIGFYHVHLPTFIARPALGPFGPLVEIPTWAYVRHCCRPLDRILVAAPDLVKRLRARGFDRLEQVPLGVDLERFRPAATATTPTDGRTHRIVYVGRLSPEKDLKVLLDAFTLLAARHDCELEIVGDGPSRAALERRASAPHIRFRGFLTGDDLAQAYADADIFVNPSPNETFSLTVVEALASDTPVVAAAQGGPVDLVDDTVGRLARPGDPADFARAIEELMTSPPPPGRCRAHVEGRFPWSRTFERELELYERALRERT